MIFKTLYRNANISKKKIKLLLNFIKKFSIKNILIYLNFINSKSSFILKKIILSALYNIKNNFKLNINKIKILNFSAFKGLYLKRILYKSKGRMSLKKKYYSNIILMIKYLI